MAEVMFNTIGIAVACSVVLLVWAWKLLNWAWLTPKRLEKCLRQQGFKGNSYRLVVGDIPEISSMTKEAKSKPIGLSDDPAPRVLPFIYKTIQTYGKNSFTWVGRTPRVHIMEPELMRTVLNDWVNYQKNHHGFNPLTRFVLCGVGSEEGQEWSKHRKIINPAFHLEKLKLMLPALSLSCSDLMSKWEKMVSETGSCELDVWDDLEALASDMISRTAFGTCYEQGRRIFKVQKEQLDYVIELIQSVYIPGWKYLPTKRNKRMKEINKEVITLLTGLIKPRMDAMRRGEAKKDDLLSMLLECNIIPENGNSKINVPLTTQEVIDNVKLFYFVGQETTAMAMTWAMVLLGTHPEWQARAREEVFQVFGHNKPDFDGLSRLKNIAMIIYEVLRLYPPVVEVTKVSHKDMKLGNLTLPAGVQIMLPLLLIHRDREIWGDDANEFKPERFSEGVATATKGRFVYMPFGAGPRVCVGQNFSLLEMKMTLAMTLQRFSIELSPSYVHAPFTVITLQPQHGLPLILRKLE